MNNSSFNQYTGNYPMTQSNSAQYYHQQRQPLHSCTQTPYNQPPYYLQQQVPGYFDRRMTPACNNYGLWGQQQVPSPQEQFYYNYTESSSFFSGHQTPGTQTLNWPVQRSVSYDYSPQSNSSGLSLPSPLAANRPVTDKKENVVTEEEKRSSTLWRMLHEIDSVEELARNMTGSRPLVKLSVEDVDRFEASDETNVPMLTDNLIINIPPGSVGMF